MNKCVICGKEALNKDVKGNYYCDEHISSSKERLFDKMSINTFLGMPDHLFD